MREREIGLSTTESHFSDILCTFCLNCVSCQKTERVGATKSKVSIDNLNGQARKSIDHTLPKNLTRNTLLENFSKTSTPPKA